MWMRITCERCQRARESRYRRTTHHYGSREYSAWDLEGHLWGFGTYPMGSPEGEPNIFPEIVYRRGVEAVSWLARAFGFTPTVQVPGPDGELAAR